MEKYMKDALEEIKEESEITAHRLETISEMLQIEKYWVFEEFMKEIRKHEPR